jgi:hypothetical protein
MKNEIKLFVTYLKRDVEKRNYKFIYLPEQVEEA